LCDDRKYSCGVQIDDGSGLKLDPSGELTASEGAGKLYDSSRANDILLAVPRMGRTLIAMNHWMRGAGSGSGVNIHHCITEGTKDSVALIFSINYGNDLTNEILSAIEMELFEAREYCGPDGNEFLNQNKDYYTTPHCQFIRGLVLVQ